MISPAVVKKNPIATNDTMRIGSEVFFGRDWESRKTCQPHLKIKEIKAQVRLLGVFNVQGAVRRGNV